MHRTVVCSLFVTGDVNGSAGKEGGGSGGNHSCSVIQCVRCEERAVKKRMNRYFCGNPRCSLEICRSTSAVQLLFSGQVDVAFKVRWEGKEFECTGHQLKVTTHCRSLPMPEIALLMIIKEWGKRNHQWGYPSTLLYERLFLNAAAFERSVCVCMYVCVRARTWGPVLHHQDSCINPLDVMYPSVDKVFGSAVVPLSFLTSNGATRDYDDDSAVCLTDNINIRVLWFSLACTLMPSSGHVSTISGPDC